MSRIPLRGALVLCFGLVLALALGAVDYINQSKRAGLAPGSLGVGAYVASITGRYGDMKSEQFAEKQRRELRGMLRRDLLPDAPSGWTRRMWTVADQARLDPRYDVQADASVPDDMKSAPVMQAMLTMDKAATERSDEAEIYVYEHGDDVIALRLSYSGGPPGGISGMAMQVVASNLRSMNPRDGFAVVGGIAFRETHLTDNRTGKPLKDQARVLTGNVGEEAQIIVRARASETAIMTLLRAVDYDQLNAMLDVPVPGVGNAAPVLDAETSRQLAQAMIAKDDVALREAARMAMERLEGVNSKAGAMALVLDSYGIGGSAADRKALTAAFTEANGGEAVQTASADDGTAASGGLLARLGGLFRGTGGGSAVKKDPIVFKCASEKGFKRCSVGD